MLPTAPAAGAVPATGAAAPPARPVPPPPTDERWRHALAEVIREPHRLTLHAQPLAELSTGQVAGYELLSRFDGAIAASPDRWFTAAEHWGVNARLQGRVLADAVSRRAVLREGMFLTVNVEPHLLTDPLVAGPLLDHADLSCLVVEITEHTRAKDVAAFTALLAELRARGARIAMDDAGTGHAGLSRLLQLRPDIVKLDRELISGIDTDQVKRALVEVLGDFVRRMDGWVLAEGIETPEELEAVVRLGVPFGQGWALARPAAQMLPALDPRVVAQIRGGAARARMDDSVAGLVRPVRSGTDPAACDVLLGPDGLPQLVRWGGTGPADAPRWSPATVVTPSTSPAEVARMAAARPVADVHAPVVCVAGPGHVLGVVRTADLLIALAGPAA
ncbi:EAL domain-containing protein (putative c-di-GMP-specific phosphodiesterase class I) [Kineococcus xinjiangensis]|uniref:EAL domain-containing protein (Putative c-di-GMP-specific phosphodiesterase class I) n=1 Tax=Kineococcus xinjiangensis TaxID=512762 RepID=A0A2S6IDJ6_9ACTN|nr:EAL domain-containing protein (putative c-di-GMP-specific phosphodiesterase class I) [Kineococcus xinjiangensis]